MFFDRRLHEMSIEYKLKAMEMRQKYRQTGCELYKILAEYYEDSTDCDKRFKITKKINKKEDPGESFNYCQCFPFCLY